MEIVWYEFKGVQYFFEPHYKEWYCGEVMFENEESVKRFINKLKQREDV